MIILDTNVFSELMRPTPSPRVVAWVAKQSAAELFTTTITEAEIFYGVELLAKGKRREGLVAAARLCLPRIWRAASSGSTATQRELFPRLPPTVVLSADLSAMPMRRSQPSLKCEGPSSRSAMVQTSRTVAFMPLTPGTFRKSVAPGCAMKAVVGG